MSNITEYQSVIYFAQNDGMKELKLSGMSGNQLAQGCIAL